MSTLANSEDPDEMPHYAAFHHSLHYLLGQKRSSGTETQFYLKIITCDPNIYNVPSQCLLYQTRKKNPIVHKGLILTQATLMSLI